MMPQEESAAETAISEAEKLLRIGEPLLAYNCIQQVR